MARPRLPLRLVLLAVVVLAGAAVIGLLIGAVNSLLELYQRLIGLPLWLRLPLVVAVALAVAGIVVLAWRIARPSKRSRTARATSAAVPTRPLVDERIERLRQRKVETAELEAELHELDRRRESGEMHVAVFGEISTGKSSLIRALAPTAEIAIDVLGGTTRSVAQHHGRLPHGRELVLADIPGSREIDGKLREQLARDEALRAHAVIYLCAADLTASQSAELGWLAGFGKPLILALNKADLYSAQERDELLAALRRRYANEVAAVVAISAGGSERFARALADGRRENVERERAAEIAALTEALERLTGGGAAALEPARESAVLAHVTQRGAGLAREAMAREAEATVVRYTRRAVIGAMAAIAPGSDIIIQGALGTAMVRELARIHDVPVRELEIDSLLARLGLTVRNTTAIVLAIAGNALKAFPGLGTLGGGVLHAIAYGLVFDSVGHAIVATLAERAELDQADAESRVRDLLAQPARERVERVARLVLDSVRNREYPGEEDP